MDNRNNLVFQGSIYLSNRTSECKRLSSFLEHGLSGITVTNEFHHDLKLVAEEIFTNIIRHGYSSKADEVVEVELEVSIYGIQLSFKDKYDEFNPLLVLDDVIAKDLSTGGMGMHLITSLTNERAYVREENFNIFTIKMMF